MPSRSFRHRKFSRSCCQFVADTWHDGEPFTADDVIFNWQYATDPAAATISIGSYRNLRMEKIDSHTVRVVFAAPSPFWPGQY